MVHNLRLVKVDFQNPSIHVDVGIYVAVGVFEFVDIVGLVAVGEGNAPKIKEFEIFIHHPDSRTAVTHKHMSAIVCQSPPLVLPDQLPLYS